MALLDGSPAIDAGDNTDAPDWDQRGPGFPRIVGIADPDNPIIDIGAFEVQQVGGARATSLHAKPVHPDVVALDGLRPSQQLVSQIASEARPGVAALDSVFVNDRSVQPRVVISRPAVVDDLSPLATHKASHPAESMSAQVLDRVVADFAEDLFEKLALMARTAPGLWR
jgi:hypothetical protein